ncbi:helix-turn-helix domain-containing protein [Micromonospora sp. NBC_01699]|uniref:GlxA family transcriptional regulator n=1 Tax=Micromonospora sp. NBC_01699 TaxID=2975984 RepID=UPI002E29D9D4|nr:helix-turn-helix domain-containing protein [Micromonospora sp. NBC_01699]
MPGDPHVIAVLAIEGVVGFDLAIPCQVFGSTRLADGGYPYEIRVCGVQSTVSASASGTNYYKIQAPYGLEAAADADTVVVPGLAVPRRAPDTVLEVLRAAAQRGARTVSICTGAFVLAQAGLLDGRRATTHWAAAAELGRRHPGVDVDAAALFTADGLVFTSAGVAAGLDLCLHLVRRDHGAAVAARTARVVVMAPSREGGQAQFIDHTPAGTEGSLAPTLAWLTENAADALTVTDIARHARVSVRTLTRRFREQTGTTPLGWLHHQRLHLARRLLETTDLSVTAVAEHSGHGSVTALRAHFQRDLQTSPASYRRSFGSAPVASLEGIDPRLRATRRSDSHLNPSRDPEWNLPNMLEQ